MTETTLSRPQLLAKVVRASAMIAALQTFIDDHGDLPIEFEKQPCTSVSAEISERQTYHVDSAGNELEGYRLETCRIHYQVL